MEPIIRVEHLTHTYGEGTPFCRSAVQDLSLDIYPGEILGILTELETQGLAASAPGRRYRRL